MERSERPLYTAAQVRARVEELAAAISRDLPGPDLVALIVLKGALHFGSDLLRAMSVPMAVDFVQVRSYHGATSTEAVTMLARPTQDLRNKHVLIVEDILDTGVTARALLEFVTSQGAAEVRFCALFDKPARRKIPVKADYTGFTVDDVFLVGYGMDFEERFRELPDVYVLR
jgi:hypoxanthine phosphoribosyltransferase